MRRPLKLALSILLTLVGAYLVEAALWSETFSTGGITASARSDGRAFFRYICGALCLSAGVFQLARLAPLPRLAARFDWSIAGITIHAALAMLLVLVAAMLHTHAGSRLQWLVADVCLILVNARFAMAFLAIRRRQTITVQGGK